jgi:predicted nucleic acid-binding protein
MPLRRFAAAMVEAHPAHEKFLTWLQRIKKGADSGLVSVHSVAEFIRHPDHNADEAPISPIAAHELIQRNVFDICEVAPLSARENAEAIRSNYKNGQLQWLGAPSVEIENRRILVSVANDGQALPQVNIANLLSRTRGSLGRKMTAEEIDANVRTMRDEWTREWERP